MVEDIIIRPAELEDIPGILEIQRGFLLKNKTIKSAERDGFLVYPLKEEEIEGIVLSESSFLFVAEDKGVVVGYALAYDLNNWRKFKSKWDKRVLVVTQIKNHLQKDKVLYFRHIVRKLNYSGVGEKLEEQVYSVAKSKGFQFVIAEILERPILNKKSKEAHEKRGYVKIGQADYMDGNFWGLYEKELN
jgi:L-amino acid N-acyltransferase YncA